jgi:hypothetical protein
MEPARLLLFFERSAEESQLLGVGEAIHALGQNDIDVKAVAQTSGAGSLIGSLLRFWFPYLSRAGIVGVTPDEALGPTAEGSAFVVTLAPERRPAFGNVLGAWLQARYGRKIRVTFDDIEIEAQTPEQVELFVSRLE